MDAWPTLSSSPRFFNEFSLNIESLNWNLLLTYNQYSSGHHRPRAIAGIYLGWQDGNDQVEGYLIWIPSLQRRIVTWNVVFSKTETYGNRLVPGKLQSPFGSEEESYCTDLVYDGKFLENLRDEPDDDDFLVGDTEAHPIESSVGRRNSREEAGRSVPSQKPNPRLFGRTVDRNRSETGHELTDTIDNLSQHLAYEREPSPEDEAEIRALLDDVDTSQPTSPSQLELEDNEDPLAELPRRSSRSTFKPNHLEDYFLGNKLDEEDASLNSIDDNDSNQPLSSRSEAAAYSIDQVSFYAFSAAAGVPMNQSFRVPKTYREKMKLPELERKIWDDAEEEELLSIREHEVADEVPIPPGVKPIGCRYVYAVKRNGDGEIVKVKVRLVVRGDEQVHGVDFFGGFAPTLRFGSLRTVLAVAAKHGMSSVQLNVTSAFLNGGLEEELYMACPQGREREGYCWKLKKALYGLKQAGRQWNLTFHDALTQRGYRQCKSGPCVYLRGTGPERLILLVYVDDILLFSKDSDQIQIAKEELKARFTMTESGSVDYMLGVNIDYNPTARTCFMSQPHYITELLERHELREAHEAKKPGAGEHLRKRIDSLATKGEIRDYASLIGGLLWIALCTRPDICQSVSVCSRFISNPGIEHFEAAKKILRYLKHTRHY